MISFENIGFGTMLLVGAAMAGEGSALHLKVGAEKLVDVPGVTKMAVGDPSICDISSVGENQVRVTAKTVGRTSIRVFKGQALTTIDCVAHLTNQTK